MQTIQIHKVCCHIAILLFLLCAVVNSQLTVIKYNVSVVVAGEKEGSNIPSSFVFSRPNMFAISASSNILYMTEDSMTKIRMLDTVSGITTLTKDLEFQPGGVALYPNSNDLLISDPVGGVIVRLNSKGIQTIVAGMKGDLGYSGDNGLATRARLNSPTGVAVASNGEVYFADKSNHVIRKISLNGNISTIAGNGEEGFSGDGGNAKTAQLNSPIGLSISSTGELYIADSKNHVIRKIDANGIISTFAGNGTVNGYGGDGSQAKQALLNTPYGVFFYESTGEVYIADTLNSLIRKVSKSGIISTVAGVPNSSGYSREDENVPATSALLSTPTSVALSSLGEMFIADNGNFYIRKVDTKGNSITLTLKPDFTGDVKKFTGDGYNSQQAFVYYPKHACTNILDETFIAESAYHKIRKISPNGIISQYAGTGDFGYSGDGSDAKLAKFNEPTRIACSKNGDIFIADLFNGAIRRIFASNGTVDTVVSGLGSPQAVILTESGELLVADRSSHVIRKISTNGVMSIIAGVLEDGGFNGDGLATKTKFSGPQDIALAPNGDLYIADYDNYLIRKLSKNGNITTVAGNGDSTVGEDYGIATSTGIGYPSSVAVSKEGEVFFSDGNNIRKITSKGILVTIFGSKNSSIPESYSDAKTIFMSATGLSFTPKGDLLVSGGFSNRILKISKQSCPANSLTDETNTFCLPLCFGTLYNDPLACSGNGNCTSINTCSCKSGFGGERCGDRVLPQPSTFSSKRGANSMVLGSALSIYNGFTNMAMTIGMIVIYFILILQ